MHRIGVYHITRSISLMVDRVMLHTINIITYFFHFFIDRKNDLIRLSHSELRRGQKDRQRKFLLDVGVTVALMQKRMKVKVKYI